MYVHKNRFEILFVYISQLTSQICMHLNTVDVQFVLMCQLTMSHLELLFVYIYQLTSQICMHLNTVDVQFVLVCQFDAVSFDVPNVVVPRSLAPCNCSHEIPASNNGTDVFVDPINWVIRPTGTTVHCSDVACTNVQYDVQNLLLPYLTA